MNAQTPPPAVPKKNAGAKRERRVPALVVGRWCAPNGPFTANDIFVPAAHQPTGDAAKEVTKLASWLKDPKNIEALLNEGLTRVNVIRKELVEAEFGEVKVLKAKVR